MAFSRWAASFLARGLVDDAGAAPPSVSPEGRCVRVLGLAVLDTGCAAGLAGAETTTGRLVGWRVLRLAGAVITTGWLVLGLAGAEIATGQRMLPPDSWLELAPRPERKKRWAGPYPV
ncbi:hypothetical protein NHF46_21615 [Arthrobacter alpinus]|nr:hypothetical protein [Arthrobacter alpinus]